MAAVLLVASAGLARGEVPAVPVGRLPDIVVPKAYRLNLQADPGAAREVEDGDDLDPAPRLLAHRDDVPSRHEDRPVDRLGARDLIPAERPRRVGSPRRHPLIGDLDPDAERPDETDTIVNLVSPEKDVDALGKKAAFDPATPMAILWLLAGYNIELKAGKKVLLVGRGKLVGAPLEKILQKSDIDVAVVDRETADLAEHTKAADVIITATGSPAILYADMIKQGAVVVDAGVAGEEGKTVGDLAPDVYERSDLTLTPTKGGVGPLTICALFDNVIRSTRRYAETEGRRAR